MNLTGILMGLLAAVAVGLGFVWVIKLEYYVGAHTAWAVAAVGVALTLASLFVPDFFLSAIMGIFGGTIIWGASELPKQEERVARGLFPVNPRRQIPGTKSPPVVNEREAKE
jgi:RsiW-degrading membrane proteinase PrsW (M82 family)